MVNKLNGCCWSDVNSILTNARMLLMMMMMTSSSRGCCNQVQVENKVNENDRAMEEHRRVSVWEEKDRIS